MDAQRTHEQDPRRSAEDDATKDPKLDRERLMDLDVTDAEGGEVKGGIPPKYDPNGPPYRE